MTRDQKSGMLRKVRNEECLLWVSPRKPCGSTFWNRYESFSPGSWPRNRPKILQRKQPRLKKLWRRLRPDSYRRCLSGSYQTCHKLTIIPFRTGSCALKSFGNFYTLCEAIEFSESVWGCSAEASGAGGCCTAEGRSEGKGGGQFEATRLRGCYDFVLCLGVLWELAMTLTFFKRPELTLLPSDLQVAQTLRTPSAQRWLAGVTWHLVLRFWCSIHGRNFWLPSLEWKDPKFQEMKKKQIAFWCFLYFESGSNSQSRSMELRGQWGLQMAELSVRT